jgi:hypothetical protein
VCSPGVGLNDVAIPEIAVGGSGVPLRWIARPQAVTEEVAVDVGKPCTVLGCDRAEFGVEVGEDVNPRRPRWQAHARRVAGAVTGVVDGAHDHRVVRRGEQAADSGEGLSDALPHNFPRPARTSPASRSRSPVVTVTCVSGDDPHSTSIKSWSIP